MWWELVFFAIDDDAKFVIVYIVNYYYLLKNQNLPYQDLQINIEHSNFLDSYPNSTLIYHVIHKLEHTHTKQHNSPHVNAEWPIVRHTNHRNQSPICLGKEAPTPSIE